MGAPDRRWRCRRPGRSPSRPLGRTEIPADQREQEEDAQRGDRPIGPPPKGSARREEEQNEAGPRRSVLPLPHFQPVLLRELPLRQSRASLLKLLAGGLQPMPQLAAPPPLPLSRKGQVQDAAPPAAPRGEGGAQRGHRGRPDHRCRRRLVGRPSSGLPDPSRLLGHEEAGRQRSRPAPPPSRSPSTCGRWDERPREKPRGGSGRSGSYVAPRRRGRRASRYSRQRGPNARRRSRRDGRGGRRTRRKRPGKRRPRKGGGGVQKLDPCPR